MFHGHQSSSVSPMRGKDDPPVRIFRSDRLERLTLISFRVFLFAWIPIVTGQISLALWLSRSVTATVLFAISGFIIWLLFEYVMHRFLFHFQTGNRHIRRLIWVMHTNHHVQPAHHLRTLMPLTVSLPLALCFEFAGIDLLGKETGSAALAGFFTGYLLYDLTHYACHNFRMKHEILARIRRHHMRHHHQDEKSNFAITLPFVDDIFSTRR